MGREGSSLPKSQGNRWPKRDLDPGPRLCQSRRRPLSGCDLFLSFALFSFSSFLLCLVRLLKDLACSIGEGVTSEAVSIKLLLFKRGNRLREGTHGPKVTWRGHMRVGAKMETHCFLISSSKCPTT